MAILLYYSPFEKGRSATVLLEALTFGWHFLGGSADVQWVRKQHTKAVEHVLFRWMTYPLKIIKVY